MEYTYHLKLIMSLFLYILCIECDISHTAYKRISLMISTSTGIQLMFAHAKLATYYGIKNAASHNYSSSGKYYNHLHSIFFCFFDGVINVDVSISRVVFHGHFFTCCLTTRRGPGAGVDKA